MTKILTNALLFQQIPSAPHPIPANVGHTYITYQPLMPHEWLYPHHRRYHRYYDEGRGLNRTSVNWYKSMGYRGRNVAGLGPLMSDEQPSAWSTYVTVADADATFQAALAAGATGIVPPMDVLDVGRMAIFLDPTGAAISVWQPRSHIGAELVNEPVSLCWNELATRDPAASAAFYSHLFEWDLRTDTFPTPDGGEMTYTEIKLGEDSVAGMMEMDESFPAEVPSHWAAYFAVEDADAIVERAVELGGTVIAPAMDIPPGRMAVIADPFGAVFQIMALNEED